jgi:hypothetical protein
VNWKLAAAVGAQEKIKAERLACSKLKKAKEPAGLAGSSQKG